MGDTGGMAGAQGGFMSMSDDQPPRTNYMGDVGSIVGGGLSFIGGRQQNEAQQEDFLSAQNFSASQAAINRQFQAGQQQSAENWMQNMSDTAMQRRVQDLKAAGLNPMLAIGQGGASTPGISAPGGSMGSSPGVPGLNNAMEAGVQSALQAQQVKAQTNLANQQALKTQQDTRTSQYQADILETETSPEMLMLHVQQLQANYGLTSGQAQQVNAVKQLVLSQTTGQDATNDILNIKKQIAGMDRDTQQATMTELIKMQNAVNQQQTQEAKSIAAVGRGEESPYGKIATAIAAAQAAGQTLNNAASAARAGAALLNPAHYIP